MSADSASSAAKAPAKVKDQSEHITSYGDMSALGPLDSRIDYIIIRIDEGRGTQD
jgi:hypothetical protein